MRRVCRGHQAGVSSRRNGAILLATIGPEMRALQAENGTITQIPRQANSANRRHTSGC